MTEHDDLGMCPDCGHPALDHHGMSHDVRRDSGCQIHSCRDDWCRCPLTCTEASEAYKRGIEAS